MCLNHKITKKIKKKNPTTPIEEVLQTSFNYLKHNMEGEAKVKTEYDN